MRKNSIPRISRETQACPSTRDIQAIFIFIIPRTRTPVSVGDSVNVGLRRASCIARLRQLCVGRIHQISIYRDRIYPTPDFAIQGCYTVARERRTLARAVGITDHVASESPHYTLLKKLALKYIEVVMGYNPKWEGVNRDAID